MADTTDDEPGGRVYTFPRIGFNLHPTTTPEPSPAPPATAPTGPDSDDSAPTLTLPTVRVRRSPLGVLDTLPAPASGQPFVPPAAALPDGPDDLPLPGTVPDTFRAEPPADLVGPRLGALGLAATLAVAVAALRGTHTVLSTWWANRQARQAEGAALREARAKHALAMEQIGHKSAQDRAKQSRKVPSSAEFGRKTLGNRSGSGSGGSGGRGSGGGGGGRSNGTKKPGSGSGSSSSRTNGPASKGPKGRGNGNSGAGGGLRTKKPGSGNGSGGSGGGRKPKKHDTPRTPKPKSPHSGTQHGSRTGLDKHRTKAQHNGKGGRGGKGRSLPDALAHDTSKAARKRLKQRRRGGLDNPVLWKDQGAKDPLTKKRPKKTPDKATKTPKTTSKTTPGGGPDMRRLDQAAWHDLKQAAARRWKKRRKYTPPIWGTAKPADQTSKAKKTRGPQAADANTKQTKARRKNHTRWAKARDYLRNKANRGRRFPGPGTAGPTTGPQAGGSRGGRRSPFENAGQATEGTTWTVTSEHVPGSQAKRWEPSAIGRGTPTLPSKGPATLEAAPGTYPARPGTSAPKEPIAMPPAPVPARREDPRITRAKNQAARAGRQVITQARHMDARHETEITLDDALDDYADFSADGFKTHDQCAKLADRATRLRDVLAVFAEQLAIENNLLGALFTGAMARMSESMDLVARMAEEMQTSSLEAAEMAETADNDLNDAYRPYTQATADAGLTVPSAPVHNEA